MSKIRNLSVDKMKDEITQLRKTISELEEELQAEMQRKKVENGESVSNGRGGLKQRIKETPIGKMIADPNSMTGKVIRAPRTAYRIIRHPSVVKNIFITREEIVEQGPLFAPIRFYLSDYDKLRFNVVMEKFDVEMMKTAVEISNKKGVELRVITCAEEAATMKYKESVDKKKIPKAKEISFYSTVDQKAKRTIFELGMDEWKRINRYF